MTEEEMINILSHGNETRNVMPEGRKKGRKDILRIRPGSIPNTKSELSTARPIKPLLIATQEESKGA